MRIADLDAHVTIQYCVSYETMCETSINTRPWNLALKVKLKYAHVYVTYKTNYDVLLFSLKLL